MNRPNEIYPSFRAAGDEDLADRLPETAGLAIHLLGGLQVRRAGRLLPRPVPTLKTASLLAYLLLHPGRTFPRSYLAGLFWPEVDEDAARGSLRTALVPIRALLALPAEEESIGSPTAVARHPSLASLGWVPGSRQSAAGALLPGPLPEENRFLVARRGTLQLTPPSDCWVDVWEFERHLTEAACLPTGSEAWFRSLETALELYRGDLLPGFEEEWCGPARDCLQQRLLACLHDLTTADAERKQYDRAIAWARRAVSVDCGDEESHRQLMFLYALRGERAKALEQYHDCRRYLREELGAAPDPATLQLFQWLQDRWQRSRCRSVDPRVSPRRGCAGALRPRRERRSPIETEELVLASELTGPLVGRERERACLEDAWERTRSRRGQLVLLAGEAGIGKSRLGRELLQEVTIEDGLALYAPCHVLGENLPYQPVTAALRGALRLAQRHGLTLCEPAWLAEVARLLPELRHPTDAMGTADGLTRLAASEAACPGWKEETDLLEGLTQFFLALSAQRPLCLFLDDLQWADPATVRFLQHLSYSARQAPILLIGAYQEGEARQNTCLRRWMNSLQTPEMAVTLTRLSEAEVLHLLLQLADGKAPETLIRLLGRRLYEETEGNPFFFWQHLRALFEEGWLSLTEDGQWRAAGEQLAGPALHRGSEDRVRAELLTRPLPLPSTVRQAVQQRVSRLCEEDRRLLACAAVIGRRFTIETLQRAAGREMECQDAPPAGVRVGTPSAPAHPRPGRTPLSMESTLTALERLLAADLIRAQSHPSVFEFSHDKIRAVLYEELLPLRRQELHRRVREAREVIWDEECDGGRESPSPDVGRRITLSVQ